MPNRSISNLSLLLSAETPSEAIKCAKALKEAGINTMIVNENLESLPLDYRPLTGKIQIYVEDRDMEKAFQIIEPLTDNPHLEKGEYIPESQSDAFAFEIHKKKVKKRNSSLEFIAYFLFFGTMITLVLMSLAGMI